MKLKLQSNALSAEANTLSAMAKKLTENSFINVATATVNL
jgi:hypothetical protein